jgi:hypothetical protein
VDHGLSGRDGTGWEPDRPDGPPPSREQLPLPRRQRQAHLEPQLRVRGSAGNGTPFAAFSPAPSPRPESPEAGSGGAHPRNRPFARAAAFHAGARLARRAARAWAGMVRPRQPDR